MDSQTENNCSCPPECCSSNRWFKPTTIIIGVLIVLGLFGNIYLLLKSPKSLYTEPGRSATQILATPTPGPTTNWKTYTNKQYGFELKYPPVWEEQGNLDNIFYFGEGGPRETQLGVKVSPITTQDNLNNFCQEMGEQKYFEAFLSGRRGRRCEGQYQINGERGVKVNYLYKYIMVGVENGGQLYTFSIGAAESQANDRFNYFDQILSTFKFLP